MSAPRWVVRVTFTTERAALGFVASATGAILSARAAEDYSLSVPYDARERYREQVRQARVMAGMDLHDAVQIDAGPEELPIIEAQP